MKEETTETELLKKSIERRKEIKEMHSRELLYRFGQSVAYHHHRLYMGITDLHDVETEIWEYENELLSRLTVRPNPRHTNYKEELKVLTGE